MRIQIAAVSAQCFENGGVCTGKSMSTVRIFSKWRQPKNLLRNLCLSNLKVSVETSLEFWISILEHIWWHIKNNLNFCMNIQYIFFLFNFDFFYKNLKGGGGSQMPGFSIFLHR